MLAEIRKETLGYQAEVKQLLDLLIHSLYSNKEIFLRELISNASDAIDKLRFEILLNQALHENTAELKISVVYDKEARTITVSDNGIGMSREEVIENIGIIARSGTHTFLQSLTGDQRNDANLIGQFGVGFYSAFIVADKVTLLTRRAGLETSQGVCWESDGQGTYTVEMIEKATNGTEVTLHLREGEDDFLDGLRLRTIIRKYSDHIALPIVMKREEKDKDGDEIVNHALALWARAKSDIIQEEYNEFYKHISHDFNEPLAYVHNHIEGKYEYTLLLYIPSRAPFDLWNRQQRQGIKLYVHRVFIMDDSEKLMPAYLRFVRGIIDSSDLPLNISREILQQNKIIDTMRADAVKKVLRTLTDLAAKDQEKYATFWKEFGLVLKEGLAEDTTNRETIAKLLRFTSTHSSAGVQDVSLEAYVSRMKKGQEKIFYIVADSLLAAQHSPLLEIFRKKGIEVLLLSDPIDSWAISYLFEFGGFQLQSVSKGEMDLSKIVDEQEESQEASPSTETHNSQELLERIKAILGDKVKDVRVTTRLTTSPVCLVSDTYDIDPGLKRLLQSSGQLVPNAKPIFEINPSHPLLINLKEETNEKNLAGWVSILFDQAVLSAGEKLEDPVNFVNTLNTLLVALGRR